MLITLDKEIIEESLIVTEPDNVISSYEPIPILKPERVSYELEPIVYEPIQETPIPTFCELYPYDPSCLNGYDNEIEALTLLEKDDHYWDSVQDIIDIGKTDISILEVRDDLIDKGYLAISGKVDFVALLGFYSDCGYKPLTIGIWDKYLRMQMGTPGQMQLPEFLDPKEWLDAIIDFLKDVIGTTLEDIFGEHWKWWLIGIIVAIIAIIILFFVGKIYITKKIEKKVMG